MSLIAALAVAGAGVGYFLGVQGNDEPDSGAAGGNGSQEVGQGGTGDEGTGGSEQPLPQVLCRSGSFGDFQLTLETQPSECEVLLEGSPIDAPSAGTSYVLDLEWTEWGAERAAADGSIFISSAGPRPAEVELSDPAVVCGELVFTRFVAKQPGTSVEPGEGATIRGCPE